MTEEKKSIILLDSDVVRHFLKGGKIIDLAKIYPDQLAILDIVKKELCKSKHLETPVNNFITFCRIHVMPFPNEIEIIKDYASLKKTFGEGESACMAVAKSKNCCLASSNLKDIKDYCDANGIRYLTTMHILVEALDKGILSEEECNKFISDVKKKGSKLPTDSIKDYIDNF